MTHNKTIFGLFEDLELTESKKEDSRKTKEKLNIGDYVDVGGGNEGRISEIIYCSGYDEHIEDSKSERPKFGRGNYGKKGRPRKAEVGSIFLCSDSKKLNFCDDCEHKIRYKLIRSGCKVKSDSSYGGFCYKIAELVVT